MFRRSLSMEMLLAIILSCITVVCVVSTVLFLVFVILLVKKFLFEKNS